ncbi:MAG: cyclopropane fatty acyl phospholipid synthase, partial [Holophagales bacterium]|nr:cyclopropane fatty acyl phospholipid synthase [Holophagales bacterium]
PWDVEVRDDRFYPEVFGRVSLGLGDAYMDGYWECERLEDFFDRVYRVDLHSSRLTWKTRLYFLRSRLFNLQAVSRAFQVGERHYDLGNDLYTAMLGPQMVYSGCYFADEGDDLASAEEKKLDLICRKLELDRGHTVLDIGCGWGSFGRFAAERYGARVVGVTVSREQAKLGAERCAGLDVEFQVRDYRSITGTYDRVVSIGMLGHVGHRNYRTFMEVAHRSLDDDGLFLLHTMGANRSTTAADPWIDRYIFPNGMAPSIAQVGSAIERLFVMEDWHNFSTDYCRTCMAWSENFDRAWPELRGSNYDERFYRMWHYYLCCFAGAFKARTLETWDVVLSKQGGRPKYGSIR